MNAVSLFTLALLQVAPGDLFSLRTQLQGLYDEISQATLQFDNEQDVSDFHTVLTADWAFVDAGGAAFVARTVSGPSTLGQPLPDSCSR